MLTLLGLKNLLWAALIVAFTWGIARILRNWNIYRVVKARQDGRTERLKIRRGSGKLAGLGFRRWFGLREGIAKGSKDSATEHQGLQKVKTLKQDHTKGFTARLRKRRAQWEGKKP